MELQKQLTHCTTREIPLFSLAGIHTTGKIVELYDGDTCKIVLPMWGALHKFNCRLVGVDTPEMRPRLDAPHREAEIAAAHRARGFLWNLATNCEDLPDAATRAECVARLAKNTKLISVVCGEFDKYGRLLVELYDVAVSVETAAVSYNQRMIMEGYAKAYDGGAKEEFSAAGDAA